MKHFILIPLAALFLTSCGSTVSSRIEKNPQLYQKLNTKDKVLVEQGKIRTGMDKEAVFLAWGKPSSSSEGENKKGKFERWQYTTLEPIYSNHIYGHFGTRYYRNRGYYRRGYGFYPGYSTNVHYVSRPSAYVDFRRGRVTDWQRGGQHSGLYR